MLKLNRRAMIALAAAATAAMTPALAQETTTAETPAAAGPGDFSLGSADAKVKIVEYASFTCPHCADFEPLLEAWTKQLPANVRVTPLPLAGGAASDLGRTYFAAVKTGQLAAIHTRMFYGIHGDKSLPAAASGNDIAAWLGGQGFDAKAFRATMASPEVQQQMQLAHDFEVRSGVEGTPTLIVNGKYRTSGASAGGYAQMLELVGWLVEKEHAAAKAPKAK